VIGVPVFSNNFAAQTEAAVYAPKLTKIDVRSAFNQIAAKGVKPTVEDVAEHLNDTVANVTPFFDEIMAVKTGRR